MYIKNSTSPHKAKKSDRQIALTRGMKQIKTEEGNRTNLFWKMCGSHTSNPRQQVVLKDDAGNILFDPTSIE